MKPSELGDILSKESWFLEQDPATARQKSWSPHRRIASLTAESASEAALPSRFTGVQGLLPPTATISMSCCMSPPGA